MNSICTINLTLCLGAGLTICVPVPRPQLRVIRTPGDWGVFQKYRIKQETLRLYPHANATENIPWRIAA